MKNLFSAFMLFVGFMVFSTESAATAASNAYLKAHPYYSAYAVPPDSPVTVNVIIKIIAPEAKNTVERAPMAVALVIDSSGSMSEAKKLDYAIRAGKTLVNSLGPNDHLALIKYDSNVTVLSPLAPVKDKQKFIRLLDTIEAGDYTFLSGGLEAGIKQLQGSRFKGTRRTILLSDGLANRGITQGEGVAALGAQVRGQGITVSTVGLGLDYDENLMQLLAQRGGGQYYYVKDSEDLPSVFRQELSLATELVTHKTRARFVGNEKIKNVQIYGYPTEQKDHTASVELSDFTSGEERQIMLSLEVDPATTDKEFSLGALEVFFSREEDGPLETINIPLTLAVEADTARRDAINKKSEESIIHVQDEILLVQAEMAQVEAMKELEAGNKENARQILRENQAAMASPALRNKAIADKRLAMSMAEEQLDQAEQDANLRMSMTKESKSSAYKLAQGKKDGYMLQNNDKGFMVEKLQRTLKEKGFYTGEVNGLYDKATEDAVRAFQKSDGLPTDGIAGPATQRALGM